ncbi:ferric reductase-like transmembrane domain-containing protein [Clostridium saccharoperbutylacetonicum]|uniref:ferric reductase-like transmembrane domain-containing protein n=1 Tax=Clostridium saccharoperbutylacetonicum TaxID=36745 RepID=UPI000983C54A|nr:ferric reductase-like transmembrane domain-containing protein [Clostridium saccharoperbutylacetonicum]AQR93254.1 ferric reductase like transmembrane component [Clostridium saccharoperbutylacetonicum]NSB34671.1 DMSO/TMAO reductase YedYZ heme-binding membrane subunit [Clostridium saccharoperbutylacetonicum]
MLILISILIVAMFIILFHKKIKKHANIFYIISGLIAIGFVLYFQFNLGNQVPKDINKYVVTIFSRSAVSTALFTIVMYTGVLDKKLNITKKLLSVRGELSIIACILTLGHNVLYGKTYFVTLFVDHTALTWAKLIAALISLVLIAMMLPLMITSFPSVRKKIPFKKWKAIQRLAYVFYGLIYVHVMVLFLPKIQKDKLFDIAIYTVIFGLYFVARVYRYLKDKEIKANRKLKLSPSV